MNDTKQELEEYLEVAKRKRKQEVKQKYLSGLCIKNAKFLKDFLEENTTYNIEIIKGAIDYDREPTPQSYKEATKDGTVHHWVLVDTGKNNFYCDLHREVSNFRDDNMGDILVSKNKPECYIVF